MEAIQLFYSSSSSSEEEKEEEEEEHEQEEPQEDVESADQQTRWVRSFPHVEGNWPSHVFIQVDPAQHPLIHQRCCHLLTNANNALSRTFIPNSKQQPTQTPNNPQDTKFLSLLDEPTTTSYHLSLARPFVLQYHQIESFTREVACALKWHKRFHVGLREPCVLVNDDQTRTFLALKVHTGIRQVLDLLQSIDGCMRHFHLPVYYENPLPHVSFASALGNHLAQRLEEWDSLALEQEDPQLEPLILVQTVQLVIGNKHFKFDLI